MSPFAATGWACGATFAFVGLVVATQSARGAASSDVIDAFLCQLPVYLLAVFLILRVHAPNASIRGFLGLRPTHLAFYPLAMLLGAAIMVPANAIFELVAKRWPLPPEDMTLPLVSGESAPRRVAMAFIVIALGPALEEIFFRGALWKPLRGAQSAAFTIFLTAALFAFAHGNWQRMVPIALVGLALGYLRSASGSLAPSLLAHAAFNAVPFYAMATQKPGEIADVPMPFALVAGGTLAAAVLLGLARLVAARTEGAALARRKDGA